MATDRDTDFHDTERPPSIGWRVASVPLIALSVFGILSLASYRSGDIAWVSATDNATVLNWMGALGAWHGYFLFINFGLAAWTLPAWGVMCGFVMLWGKRLRYRAVWMTLASLSLCGLLQFANGFFASVLASERLNIAPNAGGGVGCLITDILLEPKLGVAGASTVLGLVLFASVIMLIGPSVIMERIYVVSAGAFRQRREEEDDDSVADGDSATTNESPGNEDLSPRELKRLEKKRLAEERRAAALEAKQLRAAEREEARRLKREEKAQKKLAKAASRDEDDIIVSGDSATRADYDEDDGDDFDALNPPTATPTIRPAPAKAAPAPQPKKAAPPVMPFVADEVNYKLPTTRLLNAPAPRSKSNDAEIDEKARIIEETLAQFGITVQVVNTIRGPVITCYEIKPPAGVRVDRISTFSNDLQMALQAHSIRILSPIPGKNVMGIEVPNNQSRIINIKEIADSQEWDEACKKMAIPMLLGLDVSGTPLIADLAKMPHVLIAGTTGSGKSACLNSILAGFMMARTPEDLRMLMVDPKMVEFTPYADLPHLVVPIITEAKKVAASLQWAIMEMGRRLKMFKQVGVRNIASFNSREKAKQATLFDNGDGGDDDMYIPDKLPYIVIVIDEMADLMMVAQAEVEQRIVRLAQLSRAAGIHMILATQRPTVSIITGTIKANFPGRIAFKVTQRVDSQTILDSRGAETLIGRGDMLFSNPTNGMLLRAQGSWIDDEEINALVAWFKNQGEPVYVAEIKDKLDRMIIKPPADEFDEDEGGESADEDDADAELLRKALATIVETRRASTSSIQRVLRIGYNRAARIMDELEHRGCIGPANGSGPRDILRTSLDDRIDDDVMIDDSDEQD